LEIRVEELNEQPVLYIRTKTSLDRLPKVIGENYQKIMAYLQQLNTPPVGAPYTAYYNLDVQNMDVEMGFPVVKPLTGKEEIQSREIPAGRAVVSLYKGAYSGMEATYNEIFKWLGEKSYQPTGVFYEYYYNSPQEVPESELLTRIVIPLK
jgi:effector-binding domain-containing protein